jgi:hypothetical protein
MKTSWYPSVLSGIIIFKLVQNSNFQVLTLGYISITTNTKAFYEYLPQKYNSTNSPKYPLILFLPGLGEESDGSPGNLPKLLNNPVPKLLNQSAYLPFFNCNNSEKWAGTIIEI